MQTWAHRSLGIFYSSQWEYRDPAKARHHLSAYLKLVSEDEDPKGVREVRDLKVRQRGSVFHADLRVAVDPQLTVAAAHDLAHTVEAVMRDEFRELSQVFVHVEPTEEPNAPADSGHRE